MKKTICPKCGNEYQMGRDGATDGCDKCLGIERDREGFAWLPEETEHRYMRLADETIYTVTRAEAFGR